MFDINIPNWPENPEILTRELHTYVNYEAIEKDAHSKGFVMKESKEHYGENVLSALENLFKGKSKEEIMLKVYSLLD